MLFKFVTKVARLVKPCHLESNRKLYIAAAVVYKPEYSMAFPFCAHWTFSNSTHATQGKG